MLSQAKKHTEKWTTGQEMTRRDFLKNTALFAGSAAVVAFGSLLYACTKEPTVLGQPGHNEVWIVGKRFIPEKLTVKLETLDITVTWTNKGGEEHTVTSDNGLFNKRLAVGESFSYTFAEHGVHRYHCSRHSKMRAEVFVEQRKGDDCEGCHNA